MRSTRTAAIANRTLLAASGLLWLVVSGVHAQEVIERVLAVVEGQIVALSDVRAALTFGLVADPPQGADPIATTLNRMIDRELMLGEVQRYQPPEPDKAEVEKRLARIRGRLQSEDAFLAAMARTGFDLERLGEWVRNDLRIEEYLKERFASAGQLSDAEVDTYLQQHQSELMRDGRSLAAAQGMARAALNAERRESLVAEWLAGLRRRAEIVDLYFTAPG